MLQKILHIRIELMYNLKFDSSEFIKGLQEDMNNFIVSSQLI